jgi:hypothetical protein
MKKILILLKLIHLIFIDFENLHAQLVGRRRMI